MSEHALTLQIEERAEEELRAAYLWYLGRNPRAADRFQAAVAACISEILEAPAAAPEIDPGIRRRLLAHRFPYGILYRVVGDEIHIIAMMHLRRRPGYWRR